MKGLKYKYQFSLCFAVVVTLITVLLASGIAMAKEQTREVIIVTPYSSFFQVGGDIATNRGGYMAVANAVCDSVITRDVNQKIYPALAKSWKIAENWDYIEFFLRDDVKFQNGAPVTAEDIKYSIETHMRKELKFVYGPLYRRKFKKIEVLRPHHVRIYLTGPYPQIIYNLATATGYFPKKYREDVGDKVFADKPIGAGPFKWGDYKQDVYFKLEAVKDHYRIPPKFETAKVLFVPEASTRLAMLKAGEVDIIRLIGPHISQVKADPRLRILLNKHVTGSGLVYCDLTFPEKPSPFHDIRVRQAASLAINRKPICEKILFGTSEPLGDVISPITRGHDPTIKPDPYDPEKAKALLAEAGYPNGFETEIHASTGSRYWLEAITADLSYVGIKAKANEYEIGAWYNLFQAKKLRGLASGSLWYNSQPHVAYSGLTFFSKGMRWCYNTTPDIDRTIRKSMSAISEEDMVEYGRKVSKLIRESRIRLPLWSTHTAFGLSQKVEYWQPVKGVVFSTMYETIRLKR